MGAADGWCHVLCDVTSHSDHRRRTVIRDADGAVGDLCVIDCHAADVAQREGLAHDGQGGAAAVGHLACL